MRDDHVAIEDVLGPRRSEWPRGRVGRIRLGAWSPRRIVLGVALAIAVPWLPLPRSEPPAAPSRRASGLRPSPIVALAFHPDGDVVATTNDAGGVTLWRAGRNWMPEPAPAVGGYAWPVAFSPDGRLAVGGIGLDAMLWELGDPPRGRPMGIPLRKTTFLKFSPDGRMLVVAGLDSPDILLWDLESGRARTALRGHSRPVIAMALAPDGRSLASAAGTTTVDLGARIWDLSSGRMERQLGHREGPIGALAYSPDGRRLAGASPIERQVRIWDAGTGESVRVIAGHSRPCRSVTFSPDGGLLATAADGGDAGLWDVETGRLVRRLDGRAQYLSTVAFSPDGRLLAATGSDGDLRLWDVGELLRGPSDR